MSTTAIASTGGTFTPRGELNVAYVKLPGNQQLFVEICGQRLRVRVPGLAHGLARPQRRSFVITAAVIRLQRLQQHAAL
jgi:hypothetical protein